MLTAEFNHCKAVSCSELAQHAMHMIFYGLFRQIQLRGDFLVSKPASDHLDQLLFAPAEPQVALYVKTGHWLGPSGNKLEQAALQTHRAYGFLIRNSANRFQDLRRRSVLQNVAHNALLNRA